MSRGKYRYQYFYIFKDQEETGVMAGKYTGHVTGSEQLFRRSETQCGRTVVLYLVLPGSTWFLMFPHGLCVSSTDEADASSTFYSTLQPGFTWQVTWHDSSTVEVWFLLIKQNKHSFVFVWFLQSPWNWKHAENPSCTTCKYLNSPWYMWSYIVTLWSYVAIDKKPRSMRLKTNLGLIRHHQPTLN